MQVQIKFTTHGADSLFGGFGPGDTARVYPELAKHFVEVCKCAKYMEKPAVQAEPKAVQAEPEPESTPEPVADAPKKRGRPSSKP
jgi:hypothetical protein